jgi:hypothetical protein
MAETLFMPEIGAAMDLYEAVKGVMPTAQQIQALLAFMGLQVDLEIIETERAILLYELQADQAAALAEAKGLPQQNRTTHD